MRVVWVLAVAALKIVIDADHTRAHVHAEQEPTSPSPARHAASHQAERYAGTWRGRIVNPRNDSVIGTWTWVQGRDGTGSLTFAEEMTSFPTRLVAAAGDSVVFELLRPLDAPEGAVLRFIGRARGDSVGGTVTVQLLEGETGRRTFKGARVSTLPAIEPSECPFPQPTWSGASRIECGWLVVPESRSRPEGRTVRLAVTVARATRPGGQPPMVYISGGPGEAGAPAGTSVPMTLALAQMRDIVMYDQRGTGRSQPALCPAFNDSVNANRYAVTRQTSPEIHRPFIRQCVESLRAQGLDPEAYNTSVSAHDLADLRRALGYERWVLRGGSYGTRLAQETMRLDPLGVHSAVLIAPVPPGREGEALEWRLRLQNTLAKLFAACAADAACHEAFPNPQGDFLALWDELNREPLRLPAANGRDTVVLHGDRLVTGITRMLDATPRLARIPFILHELRRGDRLRAARALAPTVDPNAGGIAIALNRLVNCYESGGLRQSDVDSANTVPLPPFRIRVDTDACALWRNRFATGSEVEPVHSDIPTLVLAGEFDARTPIENGRLIARTLTRAFVYELPGMGHGGLPECGQDIMRQFLEDPTREPDASCIARMPKVSFAMRWSES